MELVVTLVAPGFLDPAHVAPIVADLGAGLAERLGPDAVDIRLEGDLAATRVRLAELVGDQAIDAIVQPVEGRHKSLVICDMDSTLIQQECIDELAAVHDLKPQVAAITERAMRGELDFAEALAERVALLKGIPESSIATLLDTVITPSPGARTLAATCRANGIRTVLVSGGFVQFAGPVATRLGIDASFANTLVVEGGRLAGTVTEPILGADAKRERLEAECAALGIAADQTLAIGDGANDLPMIALSGLGLAYRAKPKVEAAADGAIRHTDLTTALYALGLPRDRFEMVSDHPEADGQNEGGGRR